MEQISLPYRIALIAIAVLGLFWFVALRPGGDAAPAPAKPPAQAPGVAGLSHAVDAAHNAAAQSAANNAATEAATGGAATTEAATGTPIVKTPASATAPKVAVANKDRSGPILADLRKGNVAVVAFSGAKAADDRAVRRALAGLNRHHGKVVIRSVPIGDVADYGAITRGVSVQQAPTVLVIGRDRKARIIVGFTDSQEIGQLVSDVGGKGF